MAIYDYSGKVMTPDFQVDYNKTVLSVNHRGYSIEAPENTLPAYILSKKKGFDYVETDVSFTSDSVPVLLHDSSIDRTSNGTGNIFEMTLAQARQYDFGSWKSSKYTGTKIPTLEEFLYLCKAIILHPYIELKSGYTYTQANIEAIVDMVAKYGLKGKVTYISFNSTYLEYVRDSDEEARLGFLSTPKTADVSICTGLKTGKNQVFYDCSYYLGSNYNAITQEICNAFMAEDIPIEAWTVDSTDVILGLNKYVSGITSDNLIAGKVLYDDAING